MASDSRRRPAHRGSARNPGGVSRRPLEAARIALGERRNPERIPCWFLPISRDLRKGGRYQLRGNAGGEILVCEPPFRFNVTWGMHGQVSWVTVELSDGPAGGTVLRLEHMAHVPEEFWQQFDPGAVGVGWDQALLGLDKHHAAAKTVEPEAAAAWLASEEGRTFVHRSSQAWCDASIAAGTEPDTARAGAACTTAFYTGPEPSSRED